MMAWGVWGWGQPGPVGKGLGAQAGGARTSAVDVVIWVPPEAPTTMRTWPSSPTMITGHMEESGCLPAAGGGWGDRAAGQRPQGHQPAPHPGPAPRTWSDEVGRRGGHPELVDDVGGAEVVHLIIEQDPTDP